MPVEPLTLVGWIMMQSLIDYPGKLVARLITDALIAYVFAG